MAVAIHTQRLTRGRSLLRDESIETIPSATGKEKKSTLHTLYSAREPDLKSHKGEH
jgi:hypothetical protein